MSGIVLPSAALIKLNAFEEDVLPSYIKTQLLSAIATLRRGADIRRAKELTNTFERAGRLVAFLTLIPSLNSDTDSSIFIPLKALLDQSIFEALEKTESKKSKSIRSGRPPLIPEISSRYRKSKFLLDIENSSSTCKPHYLVDGIRQCYEQVFRNQMKSAAVSLSCMDGSIRQALASLASLDSAVEHINYSTGDVFIHDESSSALKFVEKLMQREQESLFPNELKELIDVAVQAAGAMGSQQSLDVLKQAASTLREVVRAEALISAAELIALGLKIDPSVQPGLHSSPSQLICSLQDDILTDSDSSPLIPNSNDVMDKLQEVLYSTLGSVFARMMMEERHALHNGTHMNSLSPMTEGIGQLVERLIMQGGCAEADSALLFYDLDARRGQFAASKYRDVLRAKKEGLASRLEVMSQVQGLRQAILSAHPPCSELPERSPNNAEILKAKGDGVPPRVTRLSVSISDTPTSPCSEYDGSCEDSPHRIH